MIQTMIHWFLSLIYVPGTLFLEHPERAHLVAMGFGSLLAVSMLRTGMLRRMTQLGVLVTTCAWLLFGFDEQNMQGHGYDIRADYFFKWPILLATTFIAIVFVVRDLMGSKSIRVDPAEKR